MFALKCFGKLISADQRTFTELHHVRCPPRNLIPAAGGQECRYCDPILLFADGDALIPSTRMRERRRLSDGSLSITAVSESRQDNRVLPDSEFTKHQKQYFLITARTLQLRCHNARARSSGLQSTVRVTVAAACFGLFHVSLDALEKSVNDMPASNIKAYLDVVIFIKECVLGDIKLFEVIVIKYIASDLCSSEGSALLLTHAVVSCELRVTRLALLSWLSFPLSGAH